MLRKGGGGNAYVCGKAKGKKGVSGRTEERNLYQREQKSVGGEVCQERMEGGKERESDDIHVKVSLGEGYS